MWENSIRIFYDIFVRILLNTYVRIWLLHIYVAYMYTHIYVYMFIYNLLFKNQWYALEVSHWTSGYIFICFFYASVHISFFSREQNEEDHSGSESLGHAKFYQMV